MEKEVLKHYGTPRHSGRYPWGSGKKPQRHYDFLARDKDLKKRGLSETERYKEFGFKSSVEYRAAQRIANNEVQKWEISEVNRLLAEGKNKSEIGRIMGKNESSIRSIMKKKLAVEGDLTSATSNMLKEALVKSKYIDIGDGVENNLGPTGISKERLRVAVKMLEQEGYETINIQINQLGTKDGQKTTLKVLAPPGTTYKDVKNDTENIDSVWFTDKHTEDGGYTFKSFEKPQSIDSKRILIKYDEDGGSLKDGVIEIRPGLEDLNMGSARYAQVRVAVDEKYYLKGMCVYSNDIPAGYDVIYNSNKKEGTPKEKVFKEMNFKDDGSLDVENPFGALIKAEEKTRCMQRHYIDKDGNEKLNAINIVNEEGDWYKWKDKIASQFLAKQLPDTAKRQLDLSYATKQKELEEIKSLTNPIVKKALLNEFAEKADSSAVDLKAVGFKNQKSYVILPVNSLKTNEVYAPNYKDGEQLVLVRFPFAGTFESPLVKVNNKNKEARDMIGTDSVDAIGINSKVANQLSGADFDGDSVVAIPVKNVNIQTRKARQELVDFNTKTAYPIPDEKKLTKEQEKLYFEDKAAALKKWPEIKDKTIRMTPKERGKQMGIVSNLITDMTLKDAPIEDIVKAVKHSMVVIDAEKHYLDWKQSEIDNGIQQLKERYQKKETGGYGGASTLISKAKNTVRVDEEVEVKALTPKNLSKMTEQQVADWKEGKKVMVKTGKMRYIPDKSAGVGEDGKPLKWKEVKAQTKTTQMAMTDDARTLSSGTIMENIYARYANHLKGIANQARKIARSITPFHRDKDAAKKYAEEVTSLDKKLNEAQKNKPFERAAQNYANNQMKVYREANADMDDAERKKQQNKFLERARQKMGAKKSTIYITDKEWEAIQAKAVSSSKLESIIANADKDRLKELALPRTDRSTMTSSTLNLAKAKLNAGYTQAEVAEDLGISVSTLNKALNS